MNDINLKLEELNQNLSLKWEISDNHLHKEFKFKDFISAFGFMTQVAIHAQTMDHHPEWSNVYNHVVINLTTHSEGAITDKDFELAKRIESVITTGKS
ncbi:MAG: 4a-hydroxytetrahydrobiopterin dehydratase [Gammaproteobacteria bacterium]|nr:4a-hydroxytetrahydrobiopterin dehydratase [Gammaproteobacteria bacterium]